MKIAATICMLVLGASVPLITTGQVNSYDGPTAENLDKISPVQSQTDNSITAEEVLVLEEIYLADTSRACGASPFPKYLPLGTDKLTRECAINEPDEWYQVGLTLEFTYPFLIRPSNPGEFMADAFGGFLWYHSDIYGGRSATLELGLKGDVWSLNPVCKEKKTRSKVGPGLQKNVASLHVNAKCDYQTPWWVPDEATFEFDANAGVGPAQPGFYIWLKYRKQSGGPFSLFAPKTGSRSGKVTSSPAGIDCGKDCSESYPAGTKVTLTATPDPGATFIGWDGGGCSGTGACVVTMAQPIQVAAKFQGPDLNVALTGPGSGKVTSTPAGINCGNDCSQSYTSGTAVTLTAAPSTDSIFGGWRGGGCSGTGTCTVTMNNDKNIVATFLEKKKASMPPILPLLLDEAEPGKTCGDDRVYDCALKCVDEATALSYIGDGICDDGILGGIDLNCAAFKYDGGDCDIFKEGDRRSRVSPKK